MSPSPPDPVSITARSYDEGAVSWHDAHRDEPRAVSRRVGYERFAKLMRPGGLVLDLGCGSGLDATPLAELGFRLIGLDVSSAMLRLARTQPSLAGRLVLGEMRALPLANDSVDGVWADGSLHHLARHDAPAAVREAARVLRPGGVFSASTERGDFNGFVERQEGIAGRRWYSYYEVEELRHLAIAAGLSIVDEIVGGAGPHSAGFVAISARKV